MNRIIILMTILVGFTESLFPETLDDYRRSCSKSDSRSCYQLGIAYRDGLEVVQSEVAAKQFFDMACDMGSSQACSELKEIDKYRNDSTVGASDTEQDNKIVVFRKSCDRGDGDACFRIGLAYYEGSEVEQDYKIAKEYLEIACDHKVGVGCGTLGVMYENGKGARIDYAKAKAYYKKGCDYDYSNGCLMLGIYYENGRGGEQNIAKAGEYYRISKAYHEKECDNGDGNGCLMLGYAYSRGSGVSQDPKKAEAYYKKACDFGNTLGCKQVAESKK